MSRKSGRQAPLHGKSKKRHGFHGFHRFVKKYSRSDFLNLCNLCNPWRFCFCICLADAEQQNAKTQGRKEIPFGSRAWAAFGRILGRAAGESAILLSSRCPRFLPRPAQGCASAKRCAHACCSVSIFASLRPCVLLLHPFDLANNYLFIGSTPCKSAGGNHEIDPPMSCWQFPSGGLLSFAEAAGVG